MPQQNDFENITNKAMNKLKKIPLMALACLALFCSLKNVEAQRRRQPRKPSATQPDNRRVKPPPLIHEKEAIKIIHSYLKGKNIKPRVNKPLRVIDKENGRNRGRLFLRPDFLIRNDTVIEYWSPKDIKVSGKIRKDYERYKEAITKEIDLFLERIERDPTLTEQQKQEIIHNYLGRKGIKYEIPRGRSVEYVYDAFGRMVKRIKKEETIFYGGESRLPTRELVNYKIPKPNNFLDKKEICEKFKKTGGKVYFIESKNIKEKRDITKKLDKILEELEKNWILLEQEAEDIISEYFDKKGIGYKRNAGFKTDRVFIRPDFLLENKNKLPKAIEYWSQIDQKQKKIRERVYKRYEQMGGKVYRIELTNKKELLNELESIFNDVKSDYDKVGGNGLLAPQQ